MLKTNGRKKYKGGRYEFIKADEQSKKGGNGGVYEIKVLNSKMEYPMVAKFFEEK